MSTIQLARELGLIETIKIVDSVSKYGIQPFEFILVLDFESTCWSKNDNNKGAPEIIEFSVVLYDIINGKVVSEFQQYVMPTEFAALSIFCKNFTGISQHQVDNGVPLGTCLMLFNKWVKEQCCKFNFTLTNDSYIAKKCTFLTWSDWDLNVCLPNECRRKGIKKPEMFNRWIDVRALYKEYYYRRPKGLCGALNQLGLSFVGNEHCGLHDARNTASLAGRLVADGILLRITKDVLKNAVI